MDHLKQKILTQLKKSLFINKEMGDLVKKEIQTITSPSILKNIYQKLIDEEDKSQNEFFRNTIKNKEDIQRFQGAINKTKLKLSEKK